MCSLCCVSAYGQQQPSASTSAKSAVGLEPPSMSDLHVSRENQVSHYTGSSSMSHNLGLVQNKELEVPVLIRYNPGGSKIDDFPGNVGQGWALLAGGSITRLQKALTLEDVSEETSAPQEVGVNPTVSSSWFSDSTLQRHLKDNYYYSIDSVQYDLFQYNFLGHSGIIGFDHNNIPRIISGGSNFTIDYEIITHKILYFPMKGINRYLNVYQQATNSAGWNALLGNPDTLSARSFGMRNLLYRFVLRDNKGIRYTFGGHDSSIEFRRTGLSAPGASPPARERQGVDPVTWYLTRIEASTGEVIEFNYERDIYQLRKTVRSHSDVTVTPGFSRSETLHYYDFLQTTMVNPCYLVSIVSPYTTVNFHSSRAQQQLQVPGNYALLFPGVPVGSLDPLGQSTTGHLIHFDTYQDMGQLRPLNLIYDSNYPMKLDSISFRDLRGTLQKTVVFSYTGSTEERLKLQSFRYRSGGSVSEAYRFRYNSLKLPAYLSPQQDHYGYFNGKPQTNRDAFVTSPVSSSTNMSLVNTYYQDREPVLQYSLAEMLDTVLYPAGGKKVLEYELHTYSKEAKRYPFDVDGLTTDQVAPGLRIRRIIYLDHDNAVLDETEYSYLHNGRSSGVRSHRPFYSIALSGAFTHPMMFLPNTSIYNGNFSRYMFNSESLNPIDALRGPIVTYTYVQEKKTGGSHVYYTFKNYDNGYHDLPYLNTISDHLHLYNHWQDEVGSSLELERGQPVSKEFYRGGDTLVRKEAYLYRDDPYRFDEYIRFFSKRKNLSYSYSAYHPSFRIAAGQRFYYYPGMKEKITTDYFMTSGNGIDSATNRECFVYSQYRELKLSKRSVSGGDTLYTVNLYANDYSDGSGFLSLLKSTGDRASVVENVVVKSTGGARLVISGNVNKYSFTNPGLLSSIHTLDIAGSIDLNSFSFSNGHVGLLDHYNSANVLNIDGVGSFAPHIQYGEIYKVNSYDSYNNPREEILAGNRYISYLWGYQGQYPVAKIENSTYSSVLDVLGQATVNSLNLLGVQDYTIRNTIHALRSHTSMENAWVSAHTYKPMVGMVSSTDMNGHTVYYEYDVFGRLSAVKDRDGNIIKTYCYNYAGEQVDCLPGLYGNDAQQQDFYRQGCPTGFIGEKITYTVPANSYRSAISKADANQKALQDIFRNGQNYANAQGSCSMEGTYVALCSQGSRQVTSGGFRYTYETFTIQVSRDPEGLFLKQSPAVVKWSHGSSVNYTTVTGNYTIGELLVEKSNTNPSPGNGLEYAVENYMVNLEYNGNNYVIVYTDCSGGLVEIEPVDDGGMAVGMLNMMVRFDTLAELCAYTADEIHEVMDVYYSNDVSSLVRCFTDASMLTPVVDGYYALYKLADSGPNYYYRIVYGHILEEGYCPQDGLVPVDGDEPPVEGGEEGPDEPVDNGMLAGFSNLVVRFDTREALCGYSANDLVPTLLLYYYDDPDTEAKCFTDSSMNSPVMDGYYTLFKEEGNDPNYWYLIVSGVIESQGICLQ